VRKTAIGLAILMFAALAGLLLATQFVDLERYRPQIAERISDWSGRPVTLGGPISLSLLPSPHVSVQDLIVCNLPGARTTEMVRVRRVDAAVSFMPLLAGRIEVTSARLVQPVIALERLADGRNNWAFGKVAVATPAGGRSEGRGAPVLGAPRAEGLKVGGLTIKVAGVSIDDGSISYRSGDTLKTAEHISLTVTGDAVSAPLHAEGTLTLLGTTLALGADVGRVGRAELPLSLTVASEPLGSAEFAGTLLLETGQPEAKGKLTLKSANPSAAAALAGVAALPPVLAKVTRVTGDLDAASDAITLDHLTLEVGDIKGDGTLRTTLGTSTAIAAKLTLNALDIDRLLAERAAAPTTGAGKVPSSQSSSPPQQASAGPDWWRLPPGVTATVELAVDGVTWRQSLLRQARLEATLEGGKADIKRLGALLPGGTELQIVGSVDAAAAVPRFVGTVRANADNLRDLLRWGGVAVAGVPADRLRRATISSRLEVDDRLMEVRALDLTLDASHLTGAATIAMRDRFALGARITVDQLNLDAYVSGEPAQSATASGSTAPSTAAEVTASAAAGLTRVTVLQAISDALVSFDANVDASVDTLIWRGQPIRKVRVTATLESRDLTLRELSVNDLGGAQGKLSGYFQGIGTAQSKTQFAFDMRGPELGRVLRLLSTSVASADTFGAFSLGGAVERQVGRFNLDTDVEVGGGKLHVIGDSPSPDTWALTASLEHPSFNRLMHLASNRYRPQGGELGPVKFDGTLEWSPENAVMRKFTAVVGGVNVDGSLQVALGSRPTVTAMLTLDALAIDKFLPARQTAALDGSDGQLAPGVMLAQAGSALPRGAERWSRVPIDLGFLSPFDADVTLAAKELSWASWRVEDPRIKLALKDSVLGVRRLSGRLFGGALAASGSIEASSNPRIRVAAQLAGADFNQALTPSGMGRLEGSFDLDASLAATGASPRELISRLDGTVSLRGHDGIIDGINVPAVNQRLAQVKGLGDLASLLKAATSGSTRFSKLEGGFKLADGIARSDDLHLVAEGGEGAGTATVDLPNWTIFSRTDVRMMSVPGTPALGITLKGPLEQLDWSLDLSAIVRAFATHAVDRLLAPQSGTPEPSGTAQPEAVPGDPAKRLKPKDVLRDLLKSPQ
jgi:uncharacterized protein involved in outer membrane biogenesis